MAEKNWRDTLYIWDGIFMVGVPTAGEKEDSKNTPVLWEGGWAPVENVPNASDAEAHLLEIKIEEQRERLLPNQNFEGKSIGNDGQGRIECNGCILNSLILFREKEQDPIRTVLLPTILSVS